MIKTDDLTSKKVHTFTVLHGTLLRTLKVSDNAKNYISILGKNLS